MRISRLVDLLCVVLVLVCGVRSVHAADCSANKPGKFKVKIDSAPQGAAVYINSKECPAVGVTPWDGALNAGDFTIIIEAPGYEPGSKAFKVAKLRKTQELFLPLIKKQEPPKIDVRADADKNMFGAQISLDGQPQGQVPMVITTTPGRHLLEIKKDGFEPLSQWVEVQNNATATIASQLKEIPKPKYGTVVVDADVPDAEVYIDGNKHPDNTPAVINNVIEGEHVIEVRKAPGQPWKQRIEVIAGQQTKVRAELAALMNGGVGVVRVISEAPGAHAVLDGTELVGALPLDIKDIKAGDHIVQVKAPGFKPEEKHVQVTAGSSQMVKFDLTPEQAADLGTLKVVSAVPDAEVFIDGADVGKVPQEKKIGAGDHPVTVRLDGFKEYAETVHVDAGKTVTVTAQLKAAGRLRVVSPPDATVLINGISVGNAPLTVDVEVGEAAVEIQKQGFQSFKQTLNVVGGKTITLAQDLVIAGPSEADAIKLRRGMSSFGARTLGRGKSTVDLNVGYPYYFAGRVTVGFGKLGGIVGFDANVSTRTMFARTELGLGARANFVDADPLSAGAFTDLYWGSKLFDSSGRNGVTWDVGGMASLTALGNVTITGRAYLDIWSDRFCPTQTTNTGTLASGGNDGFDGTPISVCSDFKDGKLSGTELMRVESLAGWKNPDDVFNRDAGIRLMLSLIAEVAIQDDVNVFGMLEGAPFQSERALFTNDFSHSMFDDDFVLYFRAGLSYKF